MTSSMEDMSDSASVDILRYATTPTSVLLLLRHHHILSTVRNRFCRCEHVHMFLTKDAVPS